MAENDNKQNNNTADWNSDDFDAVSDLSALTRKYGLNSDEDSTTKNTDSPYTHSRQPSNAQRRKSSAQTTNEYRTNGTNGAPTGPEGRRVIYEEKESEPIAEKRRRNATIQQRNVKNVASVNATRPVSLKSANSVDSSTKNSAVVKKSSSSLNAEHTQKQEQHSSDNTTNKPSDDPTAFSKAYAETKQETEDKNKDQDFSVAFSAENRLKAENEAKPSDQTGDNGEKRKHQHYETTGKEKFKNFLKSFIPWKGDSKKEIVRKIVMDVSAILVLVCFGYFINNYIEHQNQLKNSDSLKELASESSTDDDLAAQWAAIKAKYPDVDFPDRMNIKYAELYAKNQDLVGWLSIGNTNIDTPVLHNPEDITNGSDEDFYLHHNFYKNYDKYGNAYLDKYNTGLSLDKNNVIYGHNMTDGLSFAQLEKYYTIDGFEESPIIQYSTLFNDYYFKIYAVIITNGDISGDNNYLFDYTTVSFGSTENFNEFIEALDERKLYDTGVDITEDDILITLSTCSYEIEDNGRLAVIGRMVRDGESTAVDTSLATENTNIRYPQIWYDEHNMTNPFVNAYKWMPE